MGTTKVVLFRLKCLFVIKSFIFNLLDINDSSYNETEVRNVGVEIRF